jgi:sugar phosphate isomerase/epimerase
VQIGVVTDEISRDLEKAFQVGRELGIKDYELRRIGEKRVPNLSEEELKQVETLIAEYDANITALSPGIFKVSLHDSQLELHKGELLEKTLSLGKRLGVNKIVIFGIKRDEQKDNPEDMELVIKYIKELVDRAQEEGFEILLENEPGWWADTAENTLRILEGVNSPNFKLNWDPGNSIRTDVIPYPDEYELLKDYVGNVHFKDAKRVDGGYECCTIDEGEIDWAGQIEALKADGYQGNISIETHCKPRIEKTKIDFEILNKLLNK